MVNYLIGTLLLLAIGYGSVEAWPLVAGPTLSVDSPIENAVYPDGTVSVSGTVARVARLTLNGNIVLHDQHGTFSSVLAFPRGGSILTLVATDRFGRTVIATRSIFVP
ncbi:hypothetical protein HY478_03220 [Candidatus Uhrbacteria bacterium]|nr:hypothetical protein [Candidatus Uhrbacteria bacterium]